MKQHDNPQHNNSQHGDSGGSPREFPADSMPQVDFEIDFYGKILARHPLYLEVLRRQAELLAARHRHAEALLCDQRLSAALPQDAEVRYNLSCSLAILGRVAEAVGSLSLAFELGYRDFEHVESDPDLEVVRNDPHFVALLKLYRVDV